MWACQHGWESIATQLLELEADKSALDNNQMSVLMYAIQADLQNVAVGLIMQDVNVHIVGNQWETKNLVLHIIFFFKIVKVKRL